ncbi:MAG: hypothetical protein EBR02_06605, partial [Alphaproteobacteria bacterium]|nr:hypothetical protein [Alphaproteobacteria bacterium]
LTLANHLSQGKGATIRPEWGDHYWAVFPFGYPSIIMAFKWLTGDVYSASKIANGLMLLGTILLYARWLRLPVLVCSALFLSLWGLEIASFTWSENAFFFAHALALSCLGLYFETGKKSILLGFFAGLVLAATTRYIGGFLLAGYGLALLLCWFSVPRVRWFSAGFVLALAGAVFAAYVLYNIQMTGYPTGMGRDRAPETLPFLLTQFSGKMFQSLWVVLPPLLLLWFGRGRGGIINWHASTPIRLLLAVGISYLVILLALRLNSRFEQFSGRMLSPGILLIGLALLKTAYDTWQANPARATRIRALWALLFVMNVGLLYEDLRNDPFPVSYHSYQQGMERYQERYGKLADGTVIITGGYHNGTVSWNFVSPVQGDPRLFYVLYANIPLPLQEYKDFLATRRYLGKPPPAYVFDFTEFDTIQSFDAMIKKRNVDPALAQWMRKNFKAKSLVPCRDCSSFK